MNIRHQRKNECMYDLAQKHKVVHIKCQNAQTNL